MLVGLCFYCIFFQKKENKINTIIFLWLHNQKFYRELQQKVVDRLDDNLSTKLWADVGCSTGLLTRLANKKGYRVIGYDINNFSLWLAKLLSISRKNIYYKNEDFHKLQIKFDVVSATSLLSVIEDKKKALSSLIHLLKDKNSILIIIEPSKNLSAKNVKKLINGFKSFWFYKGLLLWAKAREDKAIDDTIFENLDIKIDKKYYLDDMICVRYIQKI